MTKISTILIIFSLVLSFNLNAQPKQGIGLKTGLNIAWQSKSLYGSEINPIVSSHFTAFTEVQLSKRIFMQPGLSLQGKGVGTQASMSGGENGRINMMYLEVPINLLYKLPMQKGGNLLFGGGPYAAMGLNGKEKNGSANVFRGVAGTDGYTNTDFGVNLIAGIELRPKLSLGLQQSIGLDNVAPAGYRFMGPADESYLAVIKNRVSSISLGYRF